MLTFKQFLKEGKIISGPIVGGAAYSHHMKIKHSGDIDIDGYGPHANDIDPKKYDIHDTDEHGYVRKMTHKPSGKTYDYLHGKSFTQEKPKVESNLGIQTVHNLMDHYFVRNRTKDDERLDNLTKKFKVKYYDHDWMNKHAAALHFAKHEVGEADEDKLISKAKELLGKS